MYMLTYLTDRVGASFNNNLNPEDSQIIILYLIYSLVNIIHTKKPVQTISVHISRVN